MQKLKNLLHHNHATPVTNTAGTSMNPFASQYNLPPHVANWQQGQPIPQGWRLGQRGYLKPAFAPTGSLSSWQQGQAIPQGFRTNKRGTLRPVNYFDYYNSLNGGGVNQFGTAGQSGMLHPYASQYNLPSHVANWQQGQAIPQGWRLGRKGYLKPAFVLPSQHSSWQQGQALPEGYRLSKRGTLRPVNHFSWWSSTFNNNSNSFGLQQQQRTSVLPAQLEIREKPAVVQEVIRGSVREEIQPIIHREREQLEIREEVQPIYERSVRPTLVEQRALAAEIRPEVRLGQMPIIAEGPRSSVFVETERREAFMHAPIVEEVVHKRIIEEVQPVIHREVIAPRIINERKDIYEKIVEAPTVSYTTLAPRFVGETINNSFSSGTSGGSMLHPFASQYNLPSHVANWQQGQAIPQGWRLGRKGYLKPTFALPSQHSSWRQGQAIPQGFRLNKRGTLRPVNHFDYYNSLNNNGGQFQQQQFQQQQQLQQQLLQQQGFGPMQTSSTAASSGLLHPFASQYNLPPHVANWQQGQAIPQGWRLGQRGYLKPAFAPTGSLSSWQQGQAIPEGFRLNKRGTLRPVNHFDYYNNNFNNMNKLQQNPLTANAGFAPATIRQF